MNASFSIAIPCEIDLTGIPPGITIDRSPDNYIEFSSHGRNWPVYIVSFSGAVATSLFADFLYDAIKNNTKKEPTTIMVDYEDAAFKNGEVERLIRMKIMKTQEADD